MQKFFGVCLLSVMSLMLQGAESKSRPSSGKRDFLSKSALVQSVKQEEHLSPLSSSAPTPSSPPMAIVQSKKKCNDASPSSYTDLIGSPSDFDLLTFTKASEVFTRQKNSFEDSFPK